MQEITSNIWWAISLGTIALLAIAIGFIATVVMSKQKELIIKKRQFEEVAASERKYRNLFEHSPAGMVRLTMDKWNVIDANHALFQMFRVNSLEGVQEILMKMPAGDREHLADVLSVERTIEDFKTHLQRDDGSALWISFSASQLANENNLEAIIIDITARLEAEEKINEQAKLLDLAQDAILVLDLNNRVRYWNISAERIYGYKQQDIIGKDITEFIYLEEEKKEFHHAYDLTMKQSEWSGELHQRNKEGSSIITDCRWDLVRDTGGRPNGILQVCTNITERKKLESRFLRAQRVESIGIFASGIAHDLNNALSPVLVGVEVLKRKLRDQQSRRLLRTIESSARYGTEMVYQVLSFVKGVKGTHIKLNPWKIVKDFNRLLVHILPRSITVQTRMSEKLPPILGDATQLHQVLINLCTNARDAMPEGGNLTFSAESIVVTKKMTQEFPDAAEGAYIVFEISDTGNGIPKSELHKIFEPFYTTKELGKGTGLGLSICLGIIKGHNGFMTVESVKEKGTTFKIFLPVLHAIKKNGSQPAANSEFNRKIFFIANSDNENTQVLTEGLEDQGYELLVAIGKSQVNDILFNNINSSDIVILDGFTRSRTQAVIDEVLEFIPRARFIILSSEFELGEVEVSRILQPHVFLKGPVSVELLLETIERAASGEISTV